MRGRVGGALNALITAASVISMAFAGVVAGAIGVRAVFVLAGAITLVAAELSIAMFRDKQPTNATG